MSDSAPHSECQLVTFLIAGEEYGVDVMKVREIICLPDITPSPNTAYFVEGIINLRGTVIPVISLRKKFGLPPVEPDINTRVAVMDLSSGCVGFIVDMVSEVIRIKRSEMTPAEGTIEQDWIEGILNLEKLIVVMDPEKLGDV